MRDIKHIVTCKTKDAYECTPPQNIGVSMENLAEAIHDGQFKTYGIVTQVIALLPSKVVDVTAKTSAMVAELAIEVAKHDNAITISEDIMTGLATHMRAYALTGFWKAVTYTRDGTPLAELKAST